MKIEVLKFDEETGVVQLDVDKEGTQYLIELGFNAMLMRAIEEFTNEREKNEGV